MPLSFRDHHLLRFLNQWQPLQQVDSGHLQPAPLDKAFFFYFKQNRSLGSKDRAALAREVYTLIRWELTLDALSPGPVSWEQRLTTLRSGKLNERHQLTDALQHGMPEFFMNRLKENFGTQAMTLASILQEEAPITLRVNRSLISREELLSKLPPEWGGRPGRLPDAVILQGRHALFTSPLFQAGFFEMQDEGSQELAAEVAAKKGDLVLDYCAGSGGKSLAIAPALEGRGQLYLHDIRIGALQEAEKRLRRARVQNAQCLPPQHKQWSRLVNKCDWVLVDAPCSGSGTLRRNPDMKKRITASWLCELEQQQRIIIKEALRYVAPSGRLVYATCSLFHDENEKLVEWLIDHQPVRLVKSKSLLPESGGRDGFFVATFARIDAPINKG